MARIISFTFKSLLVSNVGCSPKQAIWIMRLAAMDINYGTMSHCHQNLAPLFRVENNSVSVSINLDVYSRRKCL